MDLEQQRSNRAQAGSLLEHVQDTESPTIASVAESFKNLTIHGEEAPSPGVHGRTFVAWLQEALNEIEERRLHNRRIESSLNREPERVTLSLGIGQGSHSLISKENVEQIQHYEETHPAVRGLADLEEINRLQLYLASVSQSSSSSLELAMQAILTKRVDVPGGTLRTLIAKRGRKARTQRGNKKRQQEYVLETASAAELVEIGNKEAWSKFRTCCNQNRPGLLDDKGERFPYQGIEDRFNHSAGYRKACIASVFRANKQDAMRKDVQAALHFQSDMMDPPNPEAGINVVLTMSRTWIQGTAQRKQQEETARTAAKEIARDNGSVRPELSKRDFEAPYK